VALRSISIKVKNFIEDPHHPIQDWLSTPKSRSHGGRAVLQLRITRVILTRDRIGALPNPGCLETLSYRTGWVATSRNQLMSTQGGKGNH